ncbi:MAG: dodecin domain-containing protein [Bdellovibrionales bacterium]|nr:dodecin domain-containing protein [Bdellovibrionales bacterium]
MTNALKQGLSDIVELTDVSQKTLDDAVESAVKNASSKSRLIQDIEIQKCADTMENQPIAEPNVKIKFAFGERNS